MGSRARLFGYFYLVAIAFIIPLSSQAERLAPADFDGDGLSDFVIISSSGNVLSWSAVKYDGSRLQALGDFGRLGFHITLADWLGMGVPQPATVTTSGSKLAWRILTSAGSTMKEFGAQGDTVVSGADFSGDGLVDAAVVSKGEKDLRWIIHPALFTDSTAATIEFSFGRTSDDYFFAAPEASNDRVASITRKGSGSFLLRYFNPKTMRGTRQQITKDIPSGQLKQAPLPIKDVSGKDSLLFYSRRGKTTSFSLLRSKKKPLQVFKLQADGEVLIGNFLADLGEELAVQSGQGFIVYNPTSGNKVFVASPSGIAVDEVNINVVGASKNDPVSPPESNPPPSSEPPLAGISEVCANYSPISNGEMLIKSEISQHIPGQDPRATGYTLVCARLCPKNLARADFFFADGSYGGSVARYGTFRGNGKPRLYGAVGEAPQHFASEIANKASQIGNGKLYMQISSDRSGAGTECKEFNPTGRNGGLY